MIQVSIVSVICLVMVCLCCGFVVGIFLSRQ